jgi:VanZ family protein
MILASIKCNITSTSGKLPSIILFYWSPVFLYALLIFLFSSRPVPAGIPEMFLLDKLLHIIEYAVLGLLLIRSFENSRFPQSLEARSILSVLIAAAYGLSDEIHQQFVPSREASIYDLLADTMGAFLGVLAYVSFTSGNSKEYQGISGNNPL